MKSIRKIAVSASAVLTLAAAGAFGVSAQAQSPATGESVKSLPFILAAVGLIAIILLVVVMVLEQKKKKNGGQPPVDPTPGGQPVPPAAPQSGQTQPEAPSDNQGDGDPQNPAE